MVSQGKMAKTVKVRVQTNTYDKRIHKEVLKRKDYLVHDEGNICREGDIVRIEAIPRISPRKTFAIAEIRDDKGQKFALYEDMAKKQALSEERLKLAEFASHKDQLSKTITQIADLRKLNEIVARGETAENEADRDTLLKEINNIKAKYGIKSWPNTEPVVSLEIQQDARELSERERRLAKFPEFYEKLLLPEHEQRKNELLLKLSKVPVEKLQKSAAKNILRKWFLDPKNESPVAL